MILITLFHRIIKQKLENLFKYLFSAPADPLRQQIWIVLFFIKLKFQVRQLVLSGTKKSNLNILLSILFRLLSQHSSLNFKDAKCLKDSAWKLKCLLKHTAKEMVHRYGFRVNLFGRSKINVLFPFFPTFQEYKRNSPMFLETFLDSLHYIIHLEDKFAW